jgi:hypothetical protein
MAVTHGSSVSVETSLLLETNAAQTTSPAVSPSSSSHLSAGAAAGAAIGAISGVIIMVIAVFLLFKRSKKRQTKEAEASFHPMGSFSTGDGHYYEPYVEPMPNQNIYNQNAQIHPLPDAFAYQQPLPLFPQQNSTIGLSVLPPAQINPRSNPALHPNSKGFSELPDNSDPSELAVGPVNGGTVASPNPFRTPDRSLHELPHGQTDVLPNKLDDLNFHAQPDSVNGVS